MRKTNTLEELDNTSISSSSTWRREGFRRAGIGGGAGCLGGVAAPETFGAGRRWLGLGIARVRRCEWRRGTRLTCGETLARASQRRDGGDGDRASRRRDGGDGDRASHRRGSVAARNSSARKASAAT
ncbi:Os12g0407150 [Oryza sativa Japonica Group]|uniref:Os12g0407150 protein n=1 Tax=Oryza sativa subsp. japonica TaxID=39947 RepID=A0A0P0Y9C2_ORYSJ|nr:Os12g0407150 [Oryza sativa Japonica Group]